MNKGLILEIKEKEVIVLTKDGSFVTVQKSLAQGLDIGQELTFPRSSSSFRQAVSKKWFIPALAAACVLLMITAFISQSFWFSDKAVYAYVHVDINPSIELELNKQLEVLTVSGLNQEGDALLLLYSHQPRQKLDEVTIQLLDLAVEQGYFIENNDVLIATSLTEEQEEYVQALDSALDQVNAYLHQGANGNVAQVASANPSLVSGEQDVLEMNSEQLADTSISDTPLAKANIAIHRLQTDPEVRAEAKEKGISPGKYTLFLQAQQQGIVTEVDEIKDKSVSELARELGGLGTIRSNSEKRDHQEKDKDSNGEQQYNRGKQSPPGLDKKHGELPPGQAKKQGEDRLPPGQAKKQGEDRVPPGQAKKQGEDRVPPGQAKQQGEERVPPGQAKKQEEDRLPPGQAKKQGEDSLPQGQAKKQGEDRVPPGQAKKQGEDRVPPGQAKKQGEDRVPPGQVKKQGEDKLPPGQAKKQGDRHSERSKE